MAGYPPADWAEDWPGHHGAGGYARGSSPLRGLHLGRCARLASAVLLMRPDATGGLDRAAWLAARRAAVIAAYDAEAADYDRHEYPSATQRD